MIIDAEDNVKESGDKLLGAGLGSSCKEMLSSIKLLLVNPSQSEVYGKFSPPGYLPLGLAYLGAYAQQFGVKVKIIDIDADQIDLLNIVKEFNPHFIGITTTTPTFPNVIGLISQLRAISKAKIILGGIHATIMPEECKQYADHVIVGEGELALIDILEGNAGQIVKKELIKNLDNLPFPRRDFAGRYTYPDAIEEKCYPLITSRGCTGLCTYCCTKQMYGLNFRFRSAKNVVDEIEMLISRYKAKEIHIWDDNFILIKKRVFEIRDEIKKRGIKIKIAFPNGVRADFFDQDIASALKEMGTYSLAFGVESGNQEVLDFIKKRIKLDQVRKAVRIAKDNKLEVWGFFMIGLPSENEQTIRDTINFAKELNPDVAKFHVLKPYPRSEAFEWLDARGLILDKDYAHYGIHTSPVHKLENLSAEKLLDWQKRAYREFYLRPKIMLKQMLRMKSLNRLKLNLKAGVSVLRLTR